MRFSFFVAILLLKGSQAFLPQQPATGFAKSTTQLNAHKQKDGWFGPAAATVAGWTLAAQVALANPLAVVDQPVAPRQTAESSSLLVSAKVETMDFSMPSYGEAQKGEVNAGKEIPSFNPFGNFDFKPSEEDSAPAVEEEKVDEKAAAAAKKAEEKAAAEARKAEEKAAAEAKKEEERAAAEAKKAEKEARRLAEIEKQKEAVERAKQQKAKEEAPASASEEVSAPDISIPSFSAPDLPEVKLPEVKVPEMPKMSFSMPKLELPDAPKAPEFSPPKTPELSAPKIPEFSVPKVPEFSAPKVPEFSAPKIPEFSAPKVSIPSFEAPKSSSGGYDFGAPASSSTDEDMEPQEVRDERAKEARGVFLAADKEAQEVERQARELRNIANEKKKIAKGLKDEACKTRIGGKFLCLRPLNSGY